MDIDDTPERKKQEGTKHCSLCGKEKALSEFHRSRGNKDGRRGKCKVCKLAWHAKYRAENKDSIKAYDAKYRAENKDKKRAYDAEWRQAHPDKVRAKNHRRRARKANARGNFTADDWKQRLAYHDYKCIYCGVEKHETPQGWLTMEHLIPLSRGGTNWPSNLAPSCKSCNCSKGTKTHFEFLEYLNDQKEV